MPTPHAFSKCRFLIVFLVLLAMPALGQWQALSPFPGSARAYGVGFSDGQYGYVGLGQYPPGGQTFSDFFRFNPQTNQWNPIAAFPVPLTRAVAAGLQGKGYCGTGTSGGSKVTLWFEYHPDSNRWSPKAPFPGVARDNALCFVLNNRIYVGGGTTGQPVMDDLYAYDPETDTWTEVASLPGPRVFASAFSANGKAYMFGGFQAPGQYAPATVFEYDPQQNTWTAKGEFPGQARSHLFTFALQGKGYAGFGQHSSSPGYFTEWFQYTPETDQWTSVGSFPGNQRRFGAAFQVGAHGYLCTGLQGSNIFLSETWYYTETTTGKADLERNPLVSLFPNPAREKILISQTGTASGKMARILDARGQVVWSGPVPADGAISLVGFPPGLYRFQAGDTHLPGGASFIKLP